MHNVIIDKHPSYFELFPTSDGKAHTALILPARTFNHHRNLANDFSYLVDRSAYAKMLDTQSDAQPLSGVIPVGHLRKVALDRIFFFGEAGQYNPATSATGLTRMLRTYSDVGDYLKKCLDCDDLCAKTLSNNTIQAMSNANRYFQQALFERVLKFDSDGFKKFVLEIDKLDHKDANDLIFAEYDFFNVNSAMKTFFKGGENVKMSALSSIKYALKSLFYGLKIN